MDLEATVEAPCPPELLFGWVSDLTRYPRWLEIITRAEAVDGAGGDADAAWVVDLRARFGPMARSKRLRMERTVNTAPRHVRFERRERDDRSHAAWELAVELEPTDAGSRARMHLHYGGSLWGPVLERLLRAEIDRSRPRLVACVTASG